MKRNKLIGLVVSLLVGWVWWHRADVREWSRGISDPDRASDVAPLNTSEPTIDYRNPVALPLADIGLVNPDGTVRCALLCAKPARSQDDLWVTVPASVRRMMATPLAIRSERVIDAKRCWELRSLQPSDKQDFVVRAAEAMEWHSVALRMIPLGNVQRTVPVYADLQSCVELVRHGVPSLAPLVRVSLADLPARWPLLGKKTVVVEGRTVELLRVLAPTTRNGGDPWTIKDVPPAPATVARSGVDLVVVLDATDTATIMFPAVRQILLSLMNSLAEGTTAASRPALAAVVYTDYVEGLYFGPNREVAQILGRGGLTTDVLKFQELLDSIRPAPVGSEDIPEAMLDALFVALKHIPWREPARSRVIVLFSDCPGHMPGSSKNPFGLSVTKIAGLAHERNVRIVSLYLEGAGGPEFQNLHRRQCEELAAQTGGVCLPLAKANSWIPQLAAFLRDPDHNRWSDDGSVLAVTSEPKDQMLWTEGWTFSEVDGQPLFEFEVLLTEAQQKFLIDELQSLANEIRALDASELLSDVQRPSPRLTLALLRRCGVPVADELLNSAPDDTSALADRLDRDLLPALKQLPPANHCVWVPLHLLR